MQPNRIGRALGIGTRVAGAKLREQADRLGAATPPVATKAANTAAVADPPRAASPSVAVRGASAPAPRVQAAVSPEAKTAENSRRLARGAGRFGSALFKPLAHASSILWNQIAGLFFALFAVFFFEHSWIAWKAHRLADRHIFVYAVIGVLFAWFTVSSFWRAWHRQRQR